MKQSWTALIAAAAGAGLAACGSSETSRPDNGVAGPEALSNNIIATTNETAPATPDPAQANAGASKQIPPSESPPQPFAAPPPAAPRPPPVEPEQPAPVLEHEFMNHTDHADPPPGKNDPLR